MSIQIFKYCIFLIALQINAEAPKEFRTGKHEIEDVSSYDKLLIDSNNINPLTHANKTFQNTTLEALNQLKWNDILNNQEMMQEIFKKLGIGTVTSSKSHKKLHKKQQIGVIDAIIQGTVDELRSMSRRKILQALDNLDRVSLPLQKKSIIWEIYKNGTSVRTFGKDDLERVGDLILDIPENDLYNVNVTDLEILNYLGCMKHMTRRKASILIYSLQNRYNQSEILTSDLINHINGLICGFPSYILETLSEETIDELSPTVFRNLWACDRQQLMILLRLCMHLIRYSSIETWTNETINNLGFLIIGLNDKQIKRIEPNVMKSLNGYVIQRLDKNQYSSLSKAQLDYLKEDALVAYYQKKIYYSRCAQTSADLYCIIFIILFFINATLTYECSLLSKLICI